MRVLDAALAPIRFINRHQWLTSAIILAGAVATLVLWTLLLPLPEAHGAYSIQKSLRFNDDDSAYLNGTPGSASNRKTWTWSSWVKRGAISRNNALFGAASGSSDRLVITFGQSNSDQLRVFQGVTFDVYTNAVFRDPTAWYHLVIAFDSTQSTASDRIKLYVNGAQITSFASATWPSQNTDYSVNNNIPHYFGRWADSASDYHDGYLSDAYFIDGQALTPSSFGETDATTGSWKAKSYSGTYGTNGFHLDFADSSALGNDISGNNNDWTSNNLDATDQVRDTPTNNYATWNSVGTPTNNTLAQGNLRQTAGLAASEATVWLPSSGKWYAEMVLESSVPAAQWIELGIAGNNWTKSTLIGNTSDSWSLELETSNNYIRNNSSANAAGLGGGAANDVLQIAFDADAGELWLGKNNTWYNSGNPSTATNPTGTSITFPVRVVSKANSAASPTSIVNFGQSASPTSTATVLPYRSDAGGYFQYAPPTGFKALSTANLPAPAIAKPSLYFDAKTYTGNGSTQSITGLNFQPALTWLKDRTSANSHGLFDAVRGATQWLASNSTAAEATDADTLTAFNADGFSLGADAKFNTNNNNYISWNWKESATSGFDIVTYTGNGVSGRTVPHSLGVTPAMIIYRARNSGVAEYWQVWHKSLTDGTYAVYLNLTNGQGVGNFLAGPTASVSSQLNTSTGVNGNGTEYVAYFFAEVPGFSKFGSYTGNGSTDGPFVYTGFKPRYLMVKRTDTTTQWMIWDSARSPFNVVGTRLYANLSNADDTGFADIDFLANGFKLRGAHADDNASGGTYIYAAFAESPFKYATAGATGPANYFIAWEI